MLDYMRPNSTNRNHKRQKNEVDGDEAASCCKAKVPAYSSSNMHINQLDNKRLKSVLCMCAPLLSVSYMNIAEPNLLPWLLLVLYNN